MKTMNEQAKCETKVLLLANKVHPLEIENQKLQLQINQAHLQIFEWKLATYGMGFICCLLIFVLIKRFSLKYKRQLQIELLGQKYEKESEERMDKETKESELEEIYRFSKTRK